jgi:hypothetical protein
LEENGMLESPRGLLNIRSIVNFQQKTSDRLVLVLRDVLKEVRQLAAYSTERRLGIWQGKPSQAVPPIGPLLAYDIDR